ncbi:ATP-binding protein [Streptomyces sp. MMBL 11-3]|uniref:ATP-binding protein n=1 Tax=Streptomyces sp. MMBL 11-3 TaxID=3382639 RepID=UPI0039B48383
MTRTAVQPNVTGTPSYSEVLPCIPASVGRARALVSSVLATWGIDDDLADCGEVIVSELMANAVRHTWTHRSKVIIERQADGSVRIGVSDRSHVLPCVQRATDDAETGRGLLLASALSRSWFCETHRWGKVTWAVVEAPTESTP